MLIGGVNNITLIYDSQTPISVPETNMTDQKPQPPQTDASSEGPLNLLALQPYKDEALKIGGARDEMWIIFVNPRPKPKPNLHLGVEIVRFLYTPFS